MMYRDVCTNIFSDQEGRLGLLHSAPSEDSEEIAKLVKECAVEEGREGRWRALDDLKEILSESEETSTDYTTESGNTTELDSGESEESGEYEDTRDT